MNKRLKAKIIEVYGSQADFSMAIGVDEARISRVVRNRRKLQDEEMERWAIVLRCKPKEIFDAV